MVTSYWVAIVHGAAVIALVSVPGLWWNTWHAAKGRLSAGFVVLPGILCIGALGLFYWRLGPLCSPAYGYGWVAATAVLGVDLIRRTLLTKSWKRIHQHGDEFAIVVWLALFVQAFAFGVNPLPVAQEFALGSIIPGRMVASPPDHAIPYRTAVYFLYGKDGFTDSAVYFGKPWSVVSRGPLAPFAINALFHIFGSRPSDPPSYERSPWPTGEPGADLARSFGWLSNAMVVLGAFELMSALHISTRQKNVALAWLAISPVALINTVFLWPKLFASYFSMCSAASALRGRHLSAGALVALAWLSHPVGALLAPAILIIALATIYAERGLNPSSAARMADASLKFGLCAFLCMLPWLAFSQHLGYSNVLLYYPFGDGRGFEPALNVRSWFANRWNNFWYTLVPGAFFFHAAFMRGWLDGPLSEPLRWTVQYAKTLPAGLGFSMFALTYVGFVIPVDGVRSKAFKYGFMVFGFATMLVYWGFSGDGLGRNCLEPLTVGAIALTASAIDIARRWVAVLLVPLFVENRWVEFSGFIFEKHFSWTSVTIDAWCAFAASSFAALTILIPGCVNCLGGRWPSGSRMLNP
jgi:hypothetical protein